MAQVPPHDDDAERALLGACIAFPGCYERACKIVTVQDFFQPRNGAIFAAVGRAIQDGQAPDILTVKAQLYHADRLEEVGGPGYLAQLLDGIPRSANVEDYAGIIRRKARRRRAMADAAALQHAAMNGHDDAELEAVLGQMRASWDGSRHPRQWPACSTWDTAPTHPEWLAEGLLPKAGMAMVWAQPNAGKTYLLLRAVHELFIDQPGPLFGHPALKVPRAIRRCLWVATEETGGELRARAERVQRGLGFTGLENQALPPGQGELTHVFAPDTKNPVTLMDVPELIEAHPGSDLIVLDSLTGLRPSSLAGRRVSWDVDNDAASAVCSMLRGLAVERQCCILIVHHTGREVAKGYRGPTEYWARVDTMFGLIPQKDGSLLVKPEKCRNGRVLPQFGIRPDWTDGYRIQFVAGDHCSSANPEESAAIAMLRENRMVSSAELGLKLRLERREISRIMYGLEARGLARNTGNKAGRSPIWAWCGPETAGDQA